MPYYRCYFLRSGRIVKAEESDHADDAAAIEWATGLLRQAAPGPSIELWQGARLVHRRGEDRN